MTKKAAWMLAGVVVCAVWAGAYAAGPTTGASEKAEVLYADPGGTTTAAIVQVLPNSAKESMTLQNVKKISICQDVLIIEWGATATTLLPRQFVASINLNKRVGVGAGAATVPATQP